MYEPFSSKELLRLFTEEHARLLQSSCEPDSFQAALDMDALCLGVFTVSHLDQRGTYTFEVTTTDDQGTKISIADIARELNSKLANSVPSVHGQAIVAAGGHVQSVAKGVGSTAATQKSARPGYPRGRAH